MNKLFKKIVEGGKISVKYPKHGRLNILKRHEGTVEATGDGPNGPYATINEGTKGYRTLRYDRMIDPICS
ncbi:MAG TPA: hypothetical protein DCF84_06780 [Bacteroidetes bacterium]|nr:hypothetical protein [Bacteroidota bacterium]